MTSYIGWSSVKFRQVKATPKSLDKLFSLERRSEEPIFQFAQNFLFFIIVTCSIHLSLNEFFIFFFLSISFFFYFLLFFSISFVELIVVLNISVVVFYVSCDSTSTTLMFYSFFAFLVFILNIMIYRGSAFVMNNCNLMYTYNFEVVRYNYSNFHNIIFETSSTLGNLGFSNSAKAELVSNCF